MENYTVNIAWSTESINNYIKVIESGTYNDAIYDISPFYNNNIALRKPNLLYKYTDEEIQEIIKCKNDINYFVSKYCYAMTPDGLKPLSLHKYQHDILNSIVENKFNVNMAARQTGSTLVLALYTIWDSVFNDNRTSLILSYNLDSACEILGKIKIILENLPYFMKPGIMKYNQKTIIFDNENRIMVSSDKNPAIGMNIHNLIIDNASHILESNFKSLFNSLFPTMAAQTKSKIIINSTPNGYNHFYELYSKAVEGKNNFHATRMNWYDVPGRDKAWKEREIKNIGSLEFFEQEYELKFITSKQEANLNDIEPKISLINKVKKLEEDFNDLTTYTNYLKEEFEKFIKYTECMSENFNSLRNDNDDLTDKVEILTKLVEIALKEKLK